MAACFGHASEGLTEFTNLIVRFDGEHNICVSHSELISSGVKLSYRSADGTGYDDSHEYC